MTPRATTGGSPGELLLRFRLRSGLTQRELADRAGISVRALRDIEQQRVARPQATSVHRLMDGLELTDPDRRQLLSSLTGRDVRPAGDVLRVAVLGPLTIHRQGAAVPVTAPMQRALIGLLAVNANRFVSAAQITEVLWGERPPATHGSLLQSLVTRTRALLGRHPGGGTATVLGYAHGGYRLELGEDQLDLLRFEALAGRAEAALAAGRATPARELFDAALRCWTGALLTDVAPAVRQHPAAVAVQHRRVQVVLTRADLAIAAGEYPTALPWLRAVAVEEPLHEGVHARLVLALAGSGRSAMALEVYARIRDRLADELGLDPGDELAQAHLRVLRKELTPPAAGVLSAAAVVPADGGPAVPAGGDPPAPAGEEVPAARRPGVPAPVPAQLPADLPVFAGRSAQLAELDRLLPPDGPAGPRTAAPCVVTGMAGVGKTSLAVHWAHRVRTRFPDGQLYVNLRGFDPGATAMTPGEALRGFLVALGVDPARTPAGLAEQVGMYRSLLAGRRMLVVLDNAHDAEQVRPLLPGSAGCLAVITSRSRLPGLLAAEAARPLALDLPSVPEARRMLAERLGEARVAGQPAAVDDIITTCAQLPLALALVAGRAAGQPLVGLDALAGELRTARQRLEPFAGDDPVTDVRAAFSWSYRALSPDAARLFRLLALHPGPQLTGSAAASLLGCPPPDVRAPLQELSRAHLLSEPAPGRYAVHDLLRAYAVELCGRHDAGAAGQEALRRVFDHYLHSAYRAERLLESDLYHVPAAPPAAGVTPREFADAQQAAGWLDAEHEVLVATVVRAHREDFAGHVCELSWTLAYHFQRRGHWADWAATHALALSATRRLGDLPGQAHTHRLLAGAEMQLGRTDEAYRHLEDAARLYRQLGDRAGEARTRLNLAFLRDREDDAGRALTHGEEALRLFSAVDDRVGQGRALNIIGWCHARLGDYERAIDRCDEALPLLEALGDRAGQAATWDSLGYAVYRLGRWERSISCYERSLALRRAMADRYFEAEVLARLGEVHLAAGDLDAARASWQQALPALEQLDHPAAGEVRAALRRLADGGTSGLLTIGRPRI